MQKVTILCTGKLKEKFYLDAVAEYVKRLSRFCKLEIIELPEEKIEEKNASDAVVKKALDKEGKAILSSVRKGAAIVAMCIEGKQISSDELAQLKDVLALNKDLQEQIDQLTIENNQLQQDRYELNNLRSLYELDQAYSDYDKIGARVISSETDNWFSSFTINKGEEEGVQVDYNVMAGSGLVGRVVSVGPHYAKVISIISDTSSVSATVLATSNNLIVSGSLQSIQSDGTILFSQLSDPDNNVSVGDKVVTSNISDKYLPGILIGYIDSISTSSNNLTKSGTVTPAVDFSHLDEVLVVMEQKQQTGD